MKKVSTNEDVDEIYQAKGKIRLYEAELYGAILSGDPIRAAYLQDQINSLKRSIKTKYDILL